MPTLKAADFADKTAFLTTLGDTLTRQGTVSPAVRDLMGVAQEKPEWWDDAKVMYQRHHEFEQLLNPANQGPALPDGAQSLPRQPNVSWLVMLTGPILERLGPAVASTRIQGVLIGLVASILGYLGVSMTGSSKPAVPGPGDPPGVAKPLDAATTDALATKLAATIKPDVLAAAIADRVAADPKLKTLATDALAEIARKADLTDLRKSAVERLATDFNAEGVARDATAKIVEAAKATGIAVEATKQVVAGAKVDTLAADALAKIVTASNAASISAEAATRVEAVVKGPDFTKAMTSKVEETLKTEAMTKAVATEVAKQVGALDLPKGVFDKLMTSDDFFKKIATEVKK